MAMEHEIEFTNINISVVQDGDDMMIMGVITLVDPTGEGQVFPMDLKPETLDQIMLVLVTAGFGAGDDENDEPPVFDKV